MAASWDFMLCDAGGNNLAELSTATSRSVSYKRNSYAEATMTLAHEDDAAALLLNAVTNTGMPKLKGYRRGPNDSLDLPAPLRFRGYLAGMQEQSDESSTLTVTFRSPLGQLVGDGNSTGRFVRAAPLTYSAVDAGSIAKALIDLTNTNDSPTGLATDPTLIQPTVLRDRSYPVGQNIGTAVTDLTAVLDGFDFYETPVDGAGLTDAFFNVVPSQGVVNANARFEYGATTLNNVWQVQRTTTPPQNCILVTGGNGLTSVYQDTNSVAEYGEWWAHADFSTIVEQATLDAKARGLCRSYPVKTMIIVPDLGLDGCPKPFDDWNMGDTVTFYALRSALTENTQIRINAFTIPISDDGFESLTVQQWTGQNFGTLNSGSDTPLDESVTKASLIAEVLTPT